MPTSPTRRSLTRRALFAGAGVVVLGGATLAAVDARVLPGRSTMFRVLGLDGQDGGVPDVTPVPTTTRSFVSTARAGRTVGWSVTAPPSPHPLPVVVALHGYGDDHTEFTNRSLGYDRFLAQYVQRGGSPFAIAAVDGGNRYWHRRADGDDPAGMVVDEFLPLLRRQGLDVDRLGFTGYSMGGYGALHLAGALGSGRVRVATALSPALWNAAGDTARGAFDDAADFRTNTLAGRQTRLDGIPVRIDCGTGDGFEPAVRSYVAGFAGGHRPAGGSEPGGHTHGYWRRLAPAHIAFLGRRLA